MRKGYLCHPMQLYTLRRITIDEGRAQGTQVIEVATAGGLQADILPDRGLDIGQVRYRGVNVAFISKNGYDSPAAWSVHEDEFLRTFPGGLLYTCGLRSTGGQHRDGAEWHPLHGRYHSLQAEQVAAYIEHDEIIIRGVIRAMHLASEAPTAVLDWNNNYGQDEDKVILFHCGPVAQTLMAGKGTLTSHKMFDKNDPGSGWGTNEGRIRDMPMTFSNCQTKDGKLVIYISEGAFTKDPIEEAYFGCAGVAEIKGLQAKLIKLARGGFKHHTAVGTGHMKPILEEAFSTYLHYDLVDID